MEAIWSSKMSVDFQLTVWLISQKTVLFITKAVRILDRTSYFYFPQKATDVLMKALHDQNSELWLHSLLQSKEIQAELVSILSYFTEFQP
jgi:hypothetical protein